MTLPSVNINLTTIGLPGIAVLKKIVGAFDDVRADRCNCRCALSAIAWAVASLSPNVPSPEPPLPDGDPPPP
jgi:hypothetical protein